MRLYIIKNYILNNAIKDIYKIAVAKVRPIGETSESPCRRLNTFLCANEQ